MTHFFNSPRAIAQSTEQTLSQAWFHGNALARGGLLQNVVYQLFKARVQRHDRQAVGVVHQTLNNHATQLRTNQSGQLLWLLCAAGHFRQCFGNGAHVTNRHRFVQQVLQGARHHAQRQLARHQVFDQLRRLGGQLVEQLLHFVVAEQIGCVVAQHFVQVCGHGCAGVHHGVPQGTGQVTL